MVRAIHFPVTCNGIASIQNSWCPFRLNTYWYTVASTNARMGDDLKGNLEAVKRTLLEKEDALTKGTGSFLVRPVAAECTGSCQLSSVWVEHRVHNPNKLAAKLTSSPLV